MATVNCILIPTVEVSKCPVEGIDLYRGVVVQAGDTDQVIWRSKLTAYYAHLAQIDAAVAVDTISFERRHQLRLL